VSVSASLRRREPRAHLHVVPAPKTASRLWLLALGGVFAVAAVYHWLQSLGHVTPAVFTDELLFSELARSFAAGDGFVVRGEPLFFPAFVPSLLQAPAWLAGSTPLAYELAKALNTALMCSAALPAYWLARQLVRPAYALTVAVATVAGGGMLYHGYLTSEAAAYPVFLLAIAVCVHALAVPSARRDLVAVAVLGLAVLTRAQFVVLPAVFFLAILLVGRPLRRHTAALATLGLAGALGLAVGGSALGFYAGAWQLDYPVGGIIRWSGWTAALLPFSAGFLVVPGALLGVVLGVLRPRGGVERGFAALTALLLVLMPLQAGLIASGESHKPFERYVFYLVPLLFIAFFAFAERGLSAKRAYLAVAVGLGALSVFVPFASLALDSFSFDSPTLSAVETVSRWTSQGEAAALYGAAGVLAALAAALLRRRTMVLALCSVAFALAIGVTAYSGDRRMTERTLHSLAPAQPDWLEHTGIAGADVLGLPGGSLHSGWVLESWNRNVGRTFHLGDLPADPLPSTVVGLNRDGSVSEVGGEPIRSRYLVVSDAGTQVDVVGTRLKRLDEGLSLYRVEAPLRLRSIAIGVYRDRWAQSVISYMVWPRKTGRGSYRVTLALPKGRDARSVDVEAGPVRRFGTLRPGSKLTIRIPVSVRPIPELAIRIDRADFIDVDKPKPRLVGARIVRLEFVPHKGSRN
jgi:hypothetical protein